MKAIILAAGEGSRLRPFTNTVPKPLIKIFGKSIIEHNLENIYKHVLGIIIIVKYKADLIKSTLGDNYKGVPIEYQVQGDEKGTGAALKGIDTGLDVLILNGDSIFAKKDLKTIIEYNGYGVLVKEVTTPEKYGIFNVDSGDNIKEIIEKPQSFVGNLANLGVYKFNSKILDLVKKIPLSPRGEYELPDAINEFVKIHPLKALKVKKVFIDVGYPWDILSANSYFLDNIKDSKIDGEVEKGVTLKGNIILEKGAILKSGTYIEGNVFIGKNTQIGPNTYIRGNSVIGESCRIGNGVEIKNSSIGDNTKISHLSYIGDSIIGNNVNISGGFISANTRHDKANIKVPIKGQPIDSGLNKLGVIIGDNVKTGIKTYSMPGRVIQNNIYTLPGQQIK